MRFLATLLTLVIAAQPVSAGFCDMGSPDHASARSQASGDTPARGHTDGLSAPNTVSHDDSHSGMSPGMSPRVSSGMQSGSPGHGMPGSPASSAGHDCCGSGDEVQESDCADFSQCGFCTAGLSAVPTSPNSLPGLPGKSVLDLSGSEVTVRQGTPPFRPPITIS